VLYFVGQIYPLIKKKFPDVSLAGVGKGPSTAVRDLSRQDPSITVTGFVDDIKPYIEESEVVVVPLRIGSGTRLKILEAMAMAKAIVSTAVGAEGLHVTDGKNIMLADTPEMFAAKVTSVLGDPRLRQSLESEACWLVEQEYAWDVIGRKIKELL
jgi:glycosyltransferase involved in cell wall biosynthesis